jgi:hypothetical protein
MKPTATFHTRGVTMHTKFVPDHHAHRAGNPLGRRLFASIAALVLAGTAGAVTAAPAGAHAMASAGTQALVQVTCTGQDDTTYTPGVTNTPGPVTITSSVEYAPCLHVNGLQISTMSGEVFSQHERVASCTQLLGGGQGTRVIRWSNGQTSTWELTTTTQIVAGNYVVVGIGQITDGLYEGALAQRELVLPGLLEALQACSTPEGLTSVSGTFTFTITGV